MKFSKLILCSLAMLLATAQACKQDSKDKAVTPAPSTIPATPTVSTKPEVYLYQVQVDNLLLRDQPTRANDSKVVAKLQSGDFVTGKGEESANKEEAEIRGIPMKESYLKVTSTTPEQYNGWAFGGALTLVFTGSNAESPDLGKLSQFSTFLKGLNTKQITSGKKAWDYVQQNLGNVEGALADASYVLLSNFLLRMEVEGEYYAIAEKINWTEADYNAIYENKFDMNKYPATKSFATNGFKLASGEGMVFPVTDINRLHSFFSNKLTPAFRAYSSQNQTESLHIDSDDGGLMIPVEQILDRAVFWERFNTQYPYFINRHETIEHERWNLSTVLFGMNNTPTFNYETNEINADFKQVWLTAQQKYSGTKVAAKCKELADLCAAEGWKKGEKVTKFIESANNAE